MLPHFDSSSSPANASFDEHHAAEGLMEALQNFGDIPQFSSVAYGASWLLLTFAIVTMRYTFWEVVAALAIVETPQLAPRVDRPWASEMDDGSSPSPAQMQETRLTSSLRATLNLLYRTGGLLAFWRGFAMTVAYGVCSEFLDTILNGGIILMRLRWSLQPLFRSVISIAVGTILANWGTAHVHIMLTKSTYRGWYRRFPPLNTFKYVWAPTAIHLLALELTFFVPAWVDRIFGLKSGVSYLLGSGGNSTATQIALFWLVWMVAQTLRVGFLAPSGAVLLRVQASLLSEEEDTIIPVARSFDKRAAPGLLRKYEPLSFRAAWRSFDRDDVVHIFRLYVKFCVIEGVVRLAFYPILGEEVWPGSWKSFNPSL